MIRDTHTHTHYSDGSLSPEALVQTAKRLGIGAIAVTDHDTMAGCPQAAEAGRRLGVEVLWGLEISAYDYDRNRKVHLLGYQPRDPETVQQACRPYLLSRHQAQLRAVDEVVAAGYPISREDALAHTGPEGILYRQHIMHALADRGYASSIYGPLYRRLFSRGGPAFVASEYMDVYQALRLLVDCGGVPVLAHPCVYDSLELLPHLAEKGLRGMEVIHPRHTPEQRTMLGELAARYGLEAYHGSDFHGFYSETPVPLGQDIPPAQSRTAG